MDRTRKCKMSTFRLALLTTLWKRPGLTRLFLDYYAALSVPGVELIGVAAYSPPDEAPLPARRWTFVEAPNDPRSDKWNAAAEVLRGLSVDGAMVLGSDDFAHPAHITEAVTLLRDGYDWVSYKAALFYHPTEQVGYLIEWDRLGTGLAMGRSLLERTGYRPWLPRCDRNSDYALSNRAGIEARRWVNIGGVPAKLVCVRDPETLTPWQSVLRIAADRITPKGDAEQWLGEMPLNLKQRLDALYRREPAPADVAGP